MFKYILPYKGMNGIFSACQITLCRHLSLVMATELGKGVCVTHSAEVIASEIVRIHWINPDRLIYIEHYPSHQILTHGESYALVTFTWSGQKATAPKWQPLASDESKELLTNLFTH